MVGMPWASMESIWFWDKLDDLSHDGLRRKAGYCASSCGERVSPGWGTGRFRRVPFQFFSKPQPAQSVFPSGLADGRQPLPSSCFCQQYRSAK